METCPASASSLLVGIVEYELTPELVLNEVHLGSHQGHQSFAVDDDLDSLVLHHFIELLYLVCLNVVHRIGKAIAALLCEADLDSNLSPSLCTKFSPLRCYIICFNLSKAVGD